MSEHLRELEREGWVEVSVHSSGLPQVCVTRSGFEAIQQGRWLP